MSEIGKNKIENREEELKSKYGFTMKYELPNSAKGGVRLIYDSKLNLVDRKDLNIKPKAFGEHKAEIENIWYETDFPIKKNNYVIRVIYRHPCGTIELLNDFTQQLENIMKKVKSENKKCIMTGDINTEGLKISTNDHVKPFFNMTLEQSFIPTITVPTRIINSAISSV